MTKNTCTAQGPQGQGRRWAGWWGINTIKEIDYYPKKISNRITILFTELRVKQLQSEERVAKERQKNSINLEKEGKQMEA